MDSHQDLDARSLALHELAVRKIRQQPQLMAHVRANLERWRSTASARSQPYVEAWHALAARGDEECLRVATEDSPYGAAMRQASPFSGVLASSERWQFLREWKAQHAPI